MSVQSIDVHDLVSGLADQNLLIVDVREPHEFDDGHIPGAVSMPLSRFDPASLPNDPDRRVVFCCAAGTRSLQAIRAAQAAGYPFDTHYPGGFRGWVMFGGRVETG